MSVARDHANDLASVAPFERLGAVVRTVMTSADEQRRLYRNADRFGREAIEGGPIQPADVPGNPSTTHTTTGA